MSHLTTAPLPPATIPSRPATTSDHATENGVGFCQRTLLFGKSPLPINTWFPTHDTPRTVLFGPYPMRVALNATPTPGVGRLVVITHGSKGNHLGHRDTALLLAARGYTVVALLHPHDNFLDDSQSGTPQLWVDRPAHVRLAIDAVLRDERLGAHLAVENVGIVGFSLGGYTSLALLGAQPSVEALKAHCLRHPDDTLPVAPDALPMSIDEIQAQADGLQHGLTVTPDHRIKAAVLLAPLCALFPDNALASVTAPVSLYCAEHDVVLREPYHAHRLAAVLPNVQRFSTVPNAGHFSFLCPFPGPIRRELPALAEDRAGFDREAFHVRLNQEIGDFFDAVLR